MAIKQLDAQMIRKMFLSGAQNLENHKELINELNVFPVPDGDTGTNMSLTIMAAVEAVNALDDPDVGTVAKAISSGSLRGARGNSGVILSQLFRGFYKTVKEEDAVTDEILAVSLRKAVETAYKAVMKPKEGTILTVAKSVADRAQEIVGAYDDLGPFLDDLLKAGDETLERTPEMLPVLKEAGVVDSGGMGLMMILHGCVEAFYGREITKETPNEEEAEEALRYLYEAAFILKGENEFSPEETEDLKDYLKTLGDEIRFACQGDEIRASLLTNDPGVVISKALKMGTLTAVNVVNRAEDKNGEIVIEEIAAEKEEETVPAEWKDTAFLAVSRGKGLDGIFKDLGVSVIIEGGQTMNPSTDDILSAVNKAHARVVYILPNNKNIILAAEQAASLAQDCEVRVIPTKTIPQGITALLNYSPDSTPEENIEVMTEEMSRVRTGEVTYAVRDTKIDGLEIRSGDLMGIADGKIRSVGQDLVEVTLSMLKDMADEESELISLYRGEDMSQEDMDALQEACEETFPDCDIEVSDGGQPTYFCIASVE